MELNRISLKLFVKDPATVKLEAFTPFFHRWIQEHAVEGMLIDVADYAHVHNGPGIILIGHDVDYGMDFTGGRPGLLVTRKHQKNVGLQQRVRDLARLAAKAATLMEAEVALGVRFATNEAQLSLIDRLRAPNTAGAFAQYQPDIEAVAQELWGGDAKHQQATTDPRGNLAVNIRSSTSPSLAQLAERAEAGVAAAR